MMKTARGTLVAAILAGLPDADVSGIEFLEQAMDIYPGARACLSPLRRHRGRDRRDQRGRPGPIPAQTGDPPEEKRYPVVDALLDAWETRTTAPCGDQVVGHRGSARSSEVRVSSWRATRSLELVLLREPEGPRLLPAAGADGRSIPVVIPQDGAMTLIRGDRRGTGGRVGMATTPSKDFYEPRRRRRRPAGLGAAVYGPPRVCVPCLVRAAGHRRPGRAELADREHLGFPTGVGARR